MNTDYLAALGVQRYVLREPAAALPEHDSIEFEETADAAPITKQPAPESPEQQPEVAERNDSWAAIVADMESANACPNCQQSSPILGEGDQHADFVVIVDAPTTRDISEQRLLSGRDGQLMDAILTAMGHARQSIYLSSIFKCAPSENYQVGPTCNDLLVRQLNLIEPQKVLVFGEFAAQTLLRSNDPLSILRSRIHSSRAIGAAVGVTVSITEILANPARKAEVWKDLCRLMAS